MNPTQLAIYQAQIQFFVLLEESKSLEERSEEIFLNRRRLYLAQRLQYDFVATDFRRQFGIAITSLPMFFGAEYVERTRTVIGADGSRESRRYHFWRLEHPYLNDDDENQMNSYRATYHMSKRAFEHLVKELSAHEEFNLVAHNAIPTYIQIATAANSLYLFKI